MKVVSERSVERRPSSSAGRRVLAGGSIVAMIGTVAAVTTMTGAPVAADDPPVHLIVADADAFGGNGGLIDLDTGTRTTEAVASGGSFQDPYGVAVDNDGYLIVADRAAFPGDNGGIIRIDPTTGEQTPITSDRFMINPTGVVVEADGDILVVDPDARDLNGTAGVGGVIRVDPDTAEQTLLSSGNFFRNPTGIALDPDGRIVVADTAAFGGDGGVIRVDPSSGTQVEVASNGAFGDPLDLVVDPLGNIFVIDRDWDSGDGGVVRIPAGSLGLHPSVSVNEVSGRDSWGNPAGIELGPDGTIYVADPDPGGVFAVDPDSEEVTLVADGTPFAGPVGLVVAPTGPPTPDGPSGDYAPWTHAQPTDDSDFALCAAFTYTVPAGVTRLGFELVGEPGQTGTDNPITSPSPGSGGFAAMVKGEVSVTPGQQLFANVTRNGTHGSGAIPGDGDGGDMAFISTDSASHTPLEGGGCTGPFLVVAGGGGGGGMSDETFGGTGGDAGYPAGTNGRSGGSGSTSVNVPGRGGGGGTQTSGGAGGPGSAQGEAGVAQEAGDGASSDSGVGGGGGGGYFGGGGGGSGSVAGGGGGGGGSSYLRSDLVSSASVYLAPTRVTPASVTFTPVEVTPVVALEASSTTLLTGEPVTFTATVSPAPSISPLEAGSGIVTFRAGATLGTAAVDAATGVATLPAVVFQSAGVKHITASYTGNSFLTDGEASTDVTVNAVNAAPVAVDDAATTAEDTAATVDVLANDSDGDGDPLSVSIATGPAHGTATVNPQGAIVYTPAANFSGSDSFTYTANDGVAASAAATVAITVNAVNDAPVAVDDAATTAEDTAATVDVLANDSDGDGDPLSVSIATGPAHGTATVNPQGAIVYTPAANFSGSDSFTYTANDGVAASAAATVAITVNAVNDAPVAADDGYRVDEGGTLVAMVPGVLGNDSDVEGDPLNANVESGPAHGTLTLESDGSFTYVHDGGETTTDSFTYTAGDGGAESAAATVTIAVDAVNDVPVAANDSATTNEDTAVTVDVLGNDRDADGDPLSVSIASVPSHATVTVNSNGTISYTPAVNFNGGDSFTYTVGDGVAGSSPATVTISVTAVNDAPVAAADSSTTIATRPVTIDVLSNDTDVEGDQLTVTGVPGPAANGTVDISADGARVTYTAAVGFDGTDTFTYTVSDGNGGTHTATVTVTVTDPLVAADAVVRGLTGLTGGVQRSLIAKLDSIHASLAMGEGARACQTLHDFIGQVTALPVKQLSNAQKATLLNLAALIGEEHCGP